MILIVSGGDAPVTDVLHRYARQARLIIAADKGGEYCIAAGIRPDILVGDMDSLGPGQCKELEECGVVVRRFSTDKDKTDTQIALDEAISNGAREVVLLAATGSRFDHALGNVHLLYTALCAGVAARIITDDQEIFLIDGACTIQGRQGWTFSVLPFTPEVSGINLKGFVYELQGASMVTGNPYGISNVVRDDLAEITVLGGILIAILTNVP